MSEDKTNGKNRGQAGPLRTAWWNMTAPSVKIEDAEYAAGQTYEKVQYADVSENDYVNLYVPDMPAADGPAPLFVLVHGGGFVANDAKAKQAQFMYLYFREHGYACASVNYRLAGEAQYPAAIEDVKAAVRFLRANAGRYGYDADRAVIWGESAGGYLATMAAVTLDSEFSGVKFTGEEDLEKPVSGHVDGLVAFYSCPDLCMIKNDFRSEGIPSWLTWLGALPFKTDSGKSFEETWIGRPMDELTDEEKDKLNPRYYIEKNRDWIKGMHVMICHGTADITVPQIQSQRLYEAFCSGTYVKDGTLTDAEYALDNIVYLQCPKYKHADDRFYSDDNLARVDSFISAVYSSTECSKS